MLPHQPEFPLTTVAAFTLALVVSNAAVLVYVWLLGSPPDAGSTARANAPVGREEAEAGEDRSRLRVRCRNCEATNDPGYRYCRECVSELPGAADHSRTAPPSFGRFVR